MRSVSEAADQLVDAGFMSELEAFLRELSREPDFDAAELQAYDAADLMVLQTAVAMIADRANGQLEAGKLVVLGDRHGALTLGAAHALGAQGIRVHQDPLLSERALVLNAQRLGLSSQYEHRALGADLFAGATLVLMQLPKSLAELEELSWHIARYAAPDVVVLAGGRDKHMSRGMNDVLATHFSQVSASRGWRKSRVLTACAPKNAEALGDARFPAEASDPDLAFELYAYGATFGGATLDHGSRLLLRTLRERPVLTVATHASVTAPTASAPYPARIVDIGCGNGVLAVSAALQFANASVIASDQSASAVASTALTAEHAGVRDRITIERADAAEAVPTGSADLILLNPPFHTGSTVHAGIGQRLIRACGAALAPGGELRLVFNSHLPYRALIEREIGATHQIARDRTFTVLSAIKR